MSRAQRLLLVAGAAVTLVACSKAPPMNLLVVTLDTTRADYLGCYGCATAQTPNLDRLAREGYLFEHCYAAAPVTTPSHSTIFTGTYPPYHGVRDNGLFVLPARATTLAEMLGSSGYATGAAVGAFPVTRTFGLDQGFDYFNDHITATVEDFRGDRVIPSQGVFFDERPAAWVNDAIVPWLRGHLGTPFFAWVHYWDAHHPHQPPPPFDQLFRSDLYQGEIAYVDRCLGALLEILEAEGVADRTVVAVVGDHGEGRGQHNEETHSLLAYDATLHVPLLIRVPGRRGGVRIGQRVGTVDLLPTLLDLLGRPVPQEVQGRSLVPQMQQEGSAAAGSSSYYAEALSPRLSQGWGELRVLLDGRYKYIHGPRPELFDLERDPDELHDLAETEPEVCRRMQDELQGLVLHLAGDHADEAATTPDDETRERLAALGYLSTTAGEPVVVTEQLTTAGAPPQDRVGDISLMSMVRQQLQANSYLAARESAARLVDLDPDNPNYRGLLALAELGLGRTAEAADLITGTEITEQTVAVFLEVTTELFDTGHQLEGLRLTEKVVAEHATPYGCFLLAEMLSIMGDEEGAGTNLERAVELDPGYARGRLGLAIHLARLGPPERAEEEFTRLLTDNPLYPRARLNFGVFLAKAGRTDEAEAQIRRAIELSPTYWQAHLALLAVSVDAGDRQQVESTLQLIQSQCRDRRVLERAETTAALL